MVAALVSATAFAQGQGQRPTPRIGYAYPAGGQQGTTFNVSIGGQNLGNTAAAYVSGGGVQARVVNYERPLTQREFTDVREKIQELQDRRTAALRGTGDRKAGAGKAARTGPVPGWTDEDEKHLESLRAKLVYRPNRQGSPAIAETVTFEVTVAPDAAPGERELRVRTSNGMSNPIVWHVGQLPEFGAPVVNASIVPAPRPPNRDYDPRTGRQQPAQMEITLPATINGQILPGEVDQFRFTARQGQRLTIAASARALIPYLADAVPGWFQATLALYDAKGRELAYDDDFRFNPDPVLAYEIPEDGEYAIEIKDSIYRGREDFVYRIAIGELPFVTSIFPLGGAHPERAMFELSGWNLPAERLTMETKDKKPGTFLVSVRKDGQLSNTVRFALEAHPQTSEIEPNDRFATAQTIELPMIVNGRIDRAGDEDVYRFEARAGSQITAEVFARRLSSPLDSVLRLFDGGGRQLAYNDDHEDKGAGLLTHHADSRISFTLPADGAYYLTVADAQHRGGSEYGYRVRVGPPRPDFELRVVPSSINLRAGTCVPITVYALRRDGFDGEIALRLPEHARGFGLSGGRVPAGAESVQLTLSAPPAPREEPFDLQLIGSATIDGRTVNHVAVPADDLMQAFAYRHLVPARELKVSLIGRGGMFRVSQRGPLRLRPGGTARLELAAQIPRGLTKVRVEIADAPEGVTVQKATIVGEGIQVVLACDPAKAKPGLQGNLLLTAFAERASQPGATKGKGPQRVSLPSIPAIPFEIAGVPAPST
jgi:hypothetical protein